MKLGEKLALLREHHNLTQFELAEQIGVNRQSISQYETVVCMPNTDILVKIADYFHVSTDWLLGRDTSNDIVFDCKSIAKQKRLEKIEKLKKELAELEDGNVNT